jgi:hypothetical protein
MLYPMFLMVLLTLIIGILAVRTRFASVKNGDVRAKYYKLMGGQDVPDLVTKTTRNFNNQFEIPTLFYVVCTLYLTLVIDHSIAVVFAWLFVGFRVIHSFIHITYNHVVHRLLAFGTSFVCVIVLWVNLLVQKL